MSRIQYFKVLLVLLALTCAGTLHATALATASLPSNNTLTCDTVNGSSTLSIALTLAGGATAATSVAATQSPASTLTITAPGSTGVNATSGTAFTWTVTEPNGCKPGGTVTLTFTPTGGTATVATVTVTLSAPTNSYLTFSAGTSAGSPLLVYCNAATGVTTANVNVSASTGATGLTSLNKLNVGLAPNMSVNTDSTITTPTLANSAITITPPGTPSLFTGFITYTVGVKSAICANLATASANTTATISFTSGIGATTPIADSAALYVKVIQQTPITVSGALSIFCLVGSPSTAIAPPSGNVIVSSRSVASIGVAATSPSWINLGGNPGSLSGSNTTSTSSPLSFTAAAATGCNSLTRAGQTSTGSISVGPATGAPWASVTIPVTLTIVTSSPLTVNPTSLSLTYRKGGPAATGTIALTSSSASGSYFTVSGNLGAYITADASSGTAPKTGTGTRLVTFSTTSLNDTISPGTATYTVIFHVTGCQDLSIPIKVTVNNAAPVLSVSEGLTRTITWDPSTIVPTPIVTLVSSDTPISYTVTGTTGIVIGPTTGGLAFNYGTQVGVIFDPTVFQSATPGQTLNGKLSVTGGNSTITITFNVLVGAGSTQASLGALSPDHLPTGAAGQVFSVNLYGTGFVPSSTPHYSTIAALATSSSGANVTTTEAAVTTKVVNSSNIVLTITVPASGKDTLSGGLLDFTGSNVIYIGVCNPNGTSCSPSVYMALTIGAGPVITAVTSAASFNPFSSTANATPAIAPFDMISIFGTNFCNSGGTGCGSGVILGKPDSNNVYDPFLTPDGNRNLSVNFYTHPAPANLATATPLASAPLLFATNSQINALVPGDNTGITSIVGAAGIVDIAVAFGGPSSTVYSNVVAVAVAAVDPGILIIGSDGQGDAAALASSTYALINSANPAIIRVGSNPPTDTVQIYMTGLGIPADASCTTISQYDASSGLASIDGAVLQAGFLTASKGVPCFGTPLTTNPVAFGTGTPVAAQTESYAGWVPASIAGLYQVNATPPDNTGTIQDTISGSAAVFTAPTQINVSITNAAASLSSQTGVTMWVAPQLGWAAALTSCTVAKTATTTCTSIPLALGGTTGSPAYTYAANLPASGFLTIADNTAPTITNTKAAVAGDIGSYLITATAVDSKLSLPKILSATAYFNLDVQDHSSYLMSLTGSVNTPNGVVTGLAPGVYGTANTVTTVSLSSYNQVTPTGNMFFTVANDHSEPTITIDQNGVVSTTSQTPAGSYVVTVTVTDVGGTGKTGTLMFTLPVALQITSSNGATLSANASQTAPITNLNVAGATGSVTYTVVNGPILVSPTGSVTLTGSPSASKIYSATVKAVIAGGYVGYINLSIHTN